MRVVVVVSSVEKNNKTKQTQNAKAHTNPTKQTYMMG